MAFLSGIIAQSRRRRPLFSLDLQLKIIYYGRRGTMTQLEYAREGKVTPEMTAVAANENLDETGLAAAVAAGLVVIPANRNHGQPAPHRHRQGAEHQDQRQYRHLRRFPPPGGRNAENAGRPGVRLRHGDGPEHRGRHHRRAPRPAGAGHHPLRQRADLRDDGRRAAAGAIVRLPGRGADARLRPPPGRGRRRFHDHPRRPDPEGHRKTEKTAAPGRDRFPRRLAC